MQADTKHKSGTAHLRNIILVAFALSGMSSLIYEVVWARQLQLVFGSTVYAVSTLLAGFMAGFALGAYLFKDIADKSNNPWKIFSFLEIGIGLYALLAIPLVKFMPHLYLFMLGVPGFTAMQFIIAFAFVLIPATLFGATWPVITSLYSREEHFGRDIGRLYSFNSFGCAIGALSSGFVLIPFLGLSSSLFLAALMNLLIAFVFFILKRGENKYES